MKFKIITSVLLAAVLISQCLFLNISALDIDGMMNENQWKDAQVYVLITSSDVSNCGVSYGAVSVLADERADQIHLGFKAKLSETIFDGANYGVAVAVGSDEFIYITSSGVSSYDTDKFSVESAVYAYSDSSYCVEVTLGVKYGLTSVDNLNVRFVDAHGLPSNVRSVKLELSDLQTVPVTETETETEKNATTVTTTARSSEERTEKTTKPVKSIKANPETTKAGSKKTTAVKGAVGEVDDEQTDANAALPQYIGNAETYAGELGSEKSLNAKQTKLQKGLSYAAVAAIILLALGICVAVNSSRDKKEKTSDKKS